MKCFKLPPVLDSRAVLLDHIKAKLKHIPPLLLIVDELAIKLCENRSNKEITNLLQSEDSLRNAILNTKSDGIIEQKLGAELFISVSVIDTSLCAQVTGMLLDLDILSICQLLGDFKSLERAVWKAKEEYLKFKKGSCKEIFGEKIYSKVLTIHSDPELAAQLTGMLLELEVSDLQRLIDDPIELNIKLKTALSAIQNEMASEEHKLLAAYIKGVHQSLRVQSRAVGPDEAWVEHCKQTNVLEEYAERMRKLATEIWDINNSKTSDLCRIQWVVNQSEEYFHKGGCVKAAIKEDKLNEKFLKNCTNQQIQCFTHSPVLKLLDVGSCYNPFSKCSLFDVTAVDLMPAVSDVFKCDFLTVEASTNICTVSNQCFSLPLNYYDIVVFSLLLEYFPSSKQRFKCCEKAFQLLRPGGLLFILTPDSKHATANSGVMKSWRWSLASVGFWRVSYKKLKHLHCMAYRRCFNCDVPKYWFSKQHCDREPEDLMYIPQDFHGYNDKSGEDKPVQERSEFDNKLLVDIFSGLPDPDVIED